MKYGFQFCRIERVTRASESSEPGHLIDYWKKGGSS